MNGVPSLKKIERKLAKRMAGEVYPELLLLMAENETGNVFVKAFDSNGNTFNDEDGIRMVNRFEISNQGIIKDLKTNRNINIRFVFNALLGEAEDEGDEPIEVGASREWDVKNADICPVFALSDDIDYVKYCETVLEIIDEFHKKNKNIEKIMKKIDGIPFRKKVLVEKIKNNDLRR